MYKQLKMYKMNGVMDIIVSIVPSNIIQVNG